MLLLMATMLSIVVIPSATRPGTLCRHIIDGKQARMNQKCEQYLICWYEQGRYAYDGYHYGWQECLGDVRGEATLEMSHCKQ